MKRYYLSTFIGDGSHENPFRPAISDKTENWSIIDLRSDCSKVDGLCLLCADSPTVIDSAGASLLTDDLTGKAVSTRDILNSKLGLSLAKQTLPELVAELLIAPKQDKLCPPIKPARDGKYRIYLGGQISGEPPPEYGHGTITESFTGDGDALGYDLSWTENYDWDRVSGQGSLITTSSWPAWARADSDLSSVNHYAQVVCTAIGTGTQDASLGATIRHSASIVTFYLCYLWQYNNTWGLAKMINGSFTTLYSMEVTISPPHTLKIQADGSTISAWLDSANLLQVTDTAITTGVRTGLYGYRDSGAGSITFDNFEAAELGGGATAKTSAETGSGAEAKTSGNPIVTASRTETGSGVEAALKTGTFISGDAGFGSEMSRTLKEAVSGDGGTGYDARKSLVKPGDTGSDMRLSKSLGQAGMPSRQARMPSKGVNI